MSYYIRVLGKNNPNIPLIEIEKNLKKEGLIANIKVSETDKFQNWTSLEILNKKGEAIAILEKNVVENSELGSEEIEEFIEEIEDCEPKSAVDWLNDFLSKTKVIYAFQILKAAFEDDNFEIISNIKVLIWQKTDGIIQADNEGFTNQDGYHILWQFDDGVKGDWAMAVLNSKNEWIKFNMDLGNKKHRAAFFKGEIPEGVKTIE
jgi:hypothetical protein